MQQIERKRTFFQVFFDGSFIIYYVAYVFYYGDYTPYNGLIRDISTILLLVSGLLIMRNDLRRFRLTKHLIWYGVFILFSMLSCVWAKDSSLVISAFPTLFRILVVGCFLYYRISDNKDLEDICNCLMIGTVYIFIAASYRMINRYSLTTFYLFRIGDGVGSNSNMIAILALIVFFLAFHKFKNKDYRIINTIIMIFALLIILIAQSKKAIFSLLIGIIIVAVLKRGDSAKKYGKVILALIAVYFVYQILMTNLTLYSMAGYRIEEMFEELGGNTLASHSTFQRQELIRQGIEMWKSHPILGVGLNNFSIIQTVESNYYAHNNYIEMLSCLGIIGFTIYYSFHIRLVLKKVYYKLSEDDLYVTFKTLVILVLLMDVALVSFETIQIQIILILFSIIIDGSYNIKELQ